MFGNIPGNFLNADRKRTILYLVDGIWRGRKFSSVPETLTEWLPRTHRVLALWELVVRWGLCRDPRAEHGYKKESALVGTHPTPTWGIRRSSLGGGACEQSLWAEWKLCGPLFQLLAVLHFP